MSSAKKAAKSSPPGSSSSSNSPKRASLRKIDSGSSLKARKKSPRTRNKSLSPKERHAQIIQYIKDNELSQKVFQVVWVPGTYLTAETVKHVPVFWFKKYKWNKDNVLDVYAMADVEYDAEQQHLVDAIYGTPEKIALKEKRSSGSNITSNTTQQKLSNNKNKTNQSSLTKIGSNRDSMTGMTKKMPTAMMTSVATPKGGMLAAPFQMSKARSRRASSISHSSRRQSIRNLRNRSIADDSFNGLFVWQKLVASRGIDIEGLNINQFNIELNNNEILIDPDLSQEIFDFIHNFKNIVITPMANSKFDLSGGFGSAIEKQNRLHSSVNNDSTRKSSIPQQATSNHILEESREDSVDIHTDDDFDSPNKNNNDDSDDINIQSPVARERAQGTTSMFDEDRKGTKNIKFRGMEDENKEKSEGEGLSPNKNTNLKLSIVVNAGIKTNNNNNNNNNENNSKDETQYDSENDNENKKKQNDNNNEKEKGKTDNDNDTVVIVIV